MFDLWSALSALSRSVYKLYAETRHVFFFVIWLLMKNKSKEETEELTDQLTQEDNQFQYHQEEVEDVEMDVETEEVEEYNF